MANPQNPQDPQPAIIEAEADDYAGENDSAIGDDAASATSSLSSTIYKYRLENGRTYQVRPLAFISSNSLQETSFLFLSWRFLLHC